LLNDFVGKINETLYLNHFNAETEREGEGTGDQDPRHDPDEAGRAASADIRVVAVTCILLVLHDVANSIKMSFLIF